MKGSEKTWHAMCNISVYFDDCQRPATSHVSRVIVRAFNISPGKFIEAGANQILRPYDRFRR